LARRFSPTDAASRTRRRRCLYRDTSRSLRGDIGNLAFHLRQFISNLIKVSDQVSRDQRRAEPTDAFGFAM
jgi:hypothetical protein